MNVKVIFKAKDIVKALNTGIDNKKIDIIQDEGQPYADCLFNVVEYIKQDLLEMLQDDASTMPSTKERNLIVVDKNKVILPSLINNDTDNIIRTDARERAWQIDCYWRNGLSTLPSDYESIRKILSLGFPKEAKSYDNEHTETLFNCVIALAFSILETIIKSDNLICCEYED